MVKLKVFVNDIKFDRNYCHFMKSEENLKRQGEDPSYQRFGFFYPQGFQKDFF